ncbi:hypothetical protein [Pseudoalteromonas rubra]|uniref:hypothetical protein n=1 Tax=Pseudoalteromonas rubra TaxID=43658 RepID=UPI000F7A25B7|nr:hypothetical protein [Pseudoalteromonas rubra]
MDYLYVIVDYSPIFVILYGLYMTWRFETARWFLLTLGAVELVDELLISVALNWQVHYYVYAAAMNLAFLLPIMYRQKIANWLYERSGHDFFNNVVNKHYISLQELSVLLVLAAVAIINVVTWCEVLLYKYKFITNAPIKLYVRDNTVAILHLLYIGALVKYVLKAEFREGYLTNEKEITP